MDKTAMETLNARFKALKDERTTYWDPHYKDLQAYLYPDRGRFVADEDKPNRGDKKYSKIIESEAIQALLRLAAGLQSGLTPMSRPWFRLGTPDLALQNQADVRNWLGDVERRMLHYLARSNFYQASHQFYIELPFCGTAVMLCTEDLPDGLRFYVNTMGEYYLGTNQKGQVDTLFRHFWMTARQMVNQFGVANVSDQVKSMADSNPFENFRVIHAIEPNQGRTPGKADAKNKAFSSIYFEEGEKKPLSQKGFEEQPFVASRWDALGNDAYGRGPGMIVLSDVKQLQEMARTGLHALHLSVAPPLGVPRSLMGLLNLLPAGQTPMDTNEKGSVYPLYQVQPKLQDMDVAMERVRARIRDIFFTDLFITQIEGKNMTAFEVSVRQAEKLQLLGPVIEGLQSEYLDPIVTRVFNVLLRQGAFPPPPQSLNNQELRIEYISILAQAQKSHGTQNIGNFVSFVGELAKLKPDVLDKADFDQAVDEYSDATGVPPALVVADEVVAKTREQRAQAQAAMAQQEQQRQDALALASQAKDLGSIPSEGTMMGDMLQGRAPGEARTQ